MSALLPRNPHIERTIISSVFAEMNDIIDLARIWRRAAIRCAQLVIVWLLLAAPADCRDSGASAGGARLSFLTGPEDETRTGPGDETQPPGEAMPSLPPPQGENQNFDGMWIFTSAGCPYTGTLPAAIVGGKIYIRGGSGQVDPDGTLHSVGAGNGMTLTAVGQMTASTGSGTFNRSDGCVGSWIAIKRGPLNGRR